MGGKSKRKNTSPLMNDMAKNRRTGEEDEGDVEIVGSNDITQSDAEATIADLKEFIRHENQESRKSITEEIKRYNEERIVAIENSLTFALTVNETLSKRLAAVEQRAERSEQDFLQCARRICALEDELDSTHQSRLLDWLIFSGPAIPRRPRDSRGEDIPRLLVTLLERLLDFQLDMGQVSEVQREERQLRVRFTSARPGSDRDVLFRNKTRLRGTGLYIRESLTPRRLAVFNELAAKKRERKIVTVFTRGGTVFAVVSQGDRPRPVRSEEALRRLCSSLEEADNAASAMGLQHGGTPTSQVADQGGPPRPAETSPTPSQACRDPGGPTRSSADSPMEADSGAHERHLTAEHATRASGGDRSREETLQEETPRRSPAMIPRTVVSHAVEEEGRRQPQAGRPSFRDSAPVTRQSTRSGAETSREPERSRAETCLEPERRLVERSDGRLGGERTTGLRRRPGGDIRQYVLRTPGDHSKSD